MERPKSHFHVQCFVKNPCVKEEKSYSFAACEESDESDDAFCLPATGALPLLDALFPTAYALQHNNEKVSHINDIRHDFQTARNIRINMFLFSRHRTISIKNKIENLQVSTSNMDNKKGCGLRALIYQFLKSKKQMHILMLAFQLK